MKKAREIHGKYIDLGNELRKECLNYLNNTVIGSIVFDEDHAMCVVYDGGNHPEYASGYSQVKSVYRKEDGNVHLEIEDDYDYSFEGLSNEEIFEIADMVADMLDE